MSRRRVIPAAPPRLRRAVLAVVVALLGFQLVGGSLHAAGAGHDPATECQFCLALDRLDPAVAPLIATPVCVRADVAAATDERTSIPSSSFRLYAVRAPPATRRF
jgi:hypothetical protein